jgi:hypothetical protein
MAYSTTIVSVFYGVGDTLDDQTFAIPFDFIEDSSIKAELWDASDPQNPIQLPFAQTTDWSLSGTDVVSTIPITGAQNIVIYRDHLAVHETLYSSYEFPYATVNVDLDRVYQMAQENKEALTRALLNSHFTVQSGGTIITMDDVIQALSQITDLESRVTVLETTGGGGGGGIPDAPANGSEYARKDNAWVVVTDNEGISDAPANGFDYGRKNNAWSVIPGEAPGGGKVYVRNGAAATWVEGVPEAPVDGNQYARKGNAWEVVAGGGGGESNTGSNVGTSGVGVFDSKVGANLRFKKVNAASSKVTVVNGGLGESVNIDVDESQINTSNLTNGAGFISDTGVDGTLYGRRDNAWEPIVLGGGGDVLPGTLLEWAGPTVPVGYLLADNSVFDVSLYPDLYAAIGFAYGTPARDTVFGPKTGSGISGEYDFTRRGIACSFDGTVMAYSHRLIGLGTPADILFTVNAVDPITGAITVTANVPNDDGFGAKLFQAVGPVPCIAISDNGDRVALGLKTENDGGNAEVGRVVVFEWDGANYQIIFNKLGEDGVAFERFGTEVHLDASGTNMIVCTDNQKFHQYCDNFTPLVKNGTKIGTNSKFGSHVSMSRDGSVLAVGDYFDPGNIAARIYRPTGFPGTAGVPLFIEDYVIDTTDLTLFTSQSPGLPNTLSLTSNGDRILIGSETTSGWVVDLSPGTATENHYYSIFDDIFTSMQVTGVHELNWQISPDGNSFSLGNPDYVFAGSFTGNVQLFDISGGKALAGDLIIDSADDAQTGIPYQSNDGLGTIASPIGLVPAGNVLFTAANQADDIFSGPTFNTGRVDSLIQRAQVPDVNADPALLLAKKIIKT